MIIDFHTHILPADIRSKRSQFLGKDPCFDLLYADPKAKIVTVEELVSNMDHEHIDVSVALNIGWSTSRLCSETNDYIIDAVKRFPERIVGFCCIQPLDTNEAVAEIKRCASQGIKGVGELRSDAQGFDLTDETTMRPIVRAALEHNLVLLTHASEPVGHMYPGKGGITPDILYRFIRNFPELNIVCAHWGGGLPFYALMPEVAEALDKVYFDSAASPYLYSNDIFLHASGLVGDQKILFGSDYPLIRQDRIVRSLDVINLQGDAKDAILGNNARRLLALP